MNGNTKTVVIIQARMTSTRLPRKVMLQLADRTVISHVIRRCQYMQHIDVVCVAIPYGSIHDDLAKEIDSSGAVVFRGHEHDVLDRYYEAAKTLNAGVIMRVTSDCPLIDPDICSKVLHLVQSGKTEYAANNLERSWPHGLDCEAFTFETLERAAYEAHEDYDREHVTPWIRKHPEVTKLNVPGPGGKVSELRWTLDYPEDYEFLKALFSLMPKDTIPTVESILSLLSEHPQLNKINSCRTDLSRPIPIH